MEVYGRCDPCLNEDRGQEDWETTATTRNPRNLRRHLDWSPRRPADGRQRVLSALRGGLPEVLRHKNTDFTAYVKVTATLDTEMVSPVPVFGARVCMDSGFSRLPSAHSRCEYRSESSMKLAAQWFTKVLLSSMCCKPAVRRLWNTGQL